MQATETSMIDFLDAELDSHVLLWLSFLDYKLLAPRFYLDSVTHKNFISRKRGKKGF